jgi:ABC-2 type transport system ATP-binding protein
VTENWIIETTGLRKVYGQTEALRGLDLKVPAGSVCGFLGRNGAGKTTTIKVLLGMARHTAGDARVFGLDATDPRQSVEIRRRTAFVSDERDLYDYMTVEEMIGFTADFYSRWRPDLEKRYLRAFELPADRKIKALSRGMRTKLALLLALCRGAELLILDEPTSGLDPAVTEELLQALVRHVATEEMTIFFSSHQIAEVDQIADRIAIIHHGRTVIEGALDDLRENFRRIELVFDGQAPQTNFLSPGIRSVRRDGRMLTVLSSAGAGALIEETRALHPLSVEVLPVTLKEMFLATVAEEN